jgi:hypothetical protein
MMYPYMTLSDGTEVTYSEIRKNDNNEEQVLVYYERWNDKHNAFDSMECLLPDGKMSKIIGFSDEEVNKHYSRLKKLEPIIFDCARKEDGE